MAFLSTGQIVTEEMALLDRGTIQGRGVPSLALMERAGRETAKRITAWWRTEGSIVAPAPEPPLVRGAAASPTGRARIPAPRGASRHLRGRAETGPWMEPVSEWPGQHTGRFLPAEVAVIHAAPLRLADRLLGILVLGTPRASTLHAS